MRPAQTYYLSEIVQYGVWILVFGFGVDRFIVWVHLYPWSPGSESGVWRTVPLKRCPSIISAYRSLKSHKFFQISSCLQLMLVRIQSLHVPVIADTVKADIRHP